MTALWLVRHGETAWSRARKHTSTTDVPLTALGERQASALRDVLAEQDFALVLTSPRVRAERTAQLSGFGDAEIDEDLVEWQYGHYEGITTAQIRETVADWSVWTHESPGGETADEVGARLDRVVERAHAAGEDATTLVFGHSHALRVLAARWLGLPPDHGKIFHLDTATVSVLEIDRGLPVVARWNVPAAR